VVRSHYGKDTVPDGEKIYRAGNALAEWLGLHSWADIPLMQIPENIDAFRQMLKKAS
jgi:hypothetical protein